MRILTAEQKQTLIDVLEGIIEKGEEQETIQAIKDNKLIESLQKDEETEYLVAKVKDVASEHQFESLDDEDVYFLAEILKDSTSVDHEYVTFVVRDYIRYGDGEETSINFDHYI